MNAENATNERESLLAMFETLDSIPATKIQKNKETVQLSNKTIKLCFSKKSKKRVKANSNIHFIFTCVYVNLVSIHTTLSISFMIGVLENILLLRTGYTGDHFCYHFKNETTKTKRWQMT